MSIQYHKIQNIYKRDELTHKLIEGVYKLDIFAYLEDVQWEATEKIDGTNIRLIWADNKFTIKGKSDKAQMFAGVEEMMLEYALKATPLMLEKFPDQEICFYGEAYGAGIQKGGKYNKAKQFALFDIFTNGVWLNRGAVNEIAKKIEMPVAKLVAVDTLPNLVQKVKNGLKSQYGDFVSEGLVARPVVELFNNRSERIIVKIKGGDF